jgi:hypothetical protein
MKFPDGQVVLLTRLCEGQHATVLQLPAFRRSVCRDIRAPVSGIVSRKESYAQGVPPMEVNGVSC